ncbi:MAG TPA: nucleoside triphosphate pyrophosphohydrolase [Gemmatimonadales bacterium]|nr:nucleoside triphosphate pyrophosphohydrolase [Gemmatimonadales bacterium]
MQDTSALGRAMAMVRDLRGRCAWDRAQTRETLRPYLVEEVLELDHALGEEDPEAIRQELSDFLLHLAWQLVLAEELGEATAEGIADRLEAKMRRRHPHLFDLGALEPWERLKRRERAGGALAGLPRTLPPLLAAYRLQERAAGVGFDWDDASGPLDKVREELAEVEAEMATPPVPHEVPEGYVGHHPPPVADEGLAEEIGDLLFAVVNLARKLHVQPSLALDRANRKFRERFEGVERLAAERGVALPGAELEALDELWEEVKRDSR